MKLLYQRVESRLKEFERYLSEAKSPISQIWIAEEPISDPFDFSRHSENWSPIAIGDSWPKFETYYWMHIPIQIPAEWAGRSVELILYLSKEHTLHTPEGLAYVNSQLRHGLDRNHNKLILSTNAKANERFDVAVQVYTGKPLQFIGYNSVPRHQLIDCSIAVPHSSASDFYLQAKAIFDSLGVMPRDSRIWWELLEILGDCFHRIDYKYPYSKDFYISIEQALSFLQDKMRALDASPARSKVIAAGHAHIDVAWLWTLKRTREKILHTFSTVLDLMDRFPEFHYFQSQPQVYQYIKEDNPQLFEKIRERIAEGRWEADGGMWLESDCNVTSGESIVRQFLYGRRFFEEELQTNCSVLWLPDVFGYSWQLPQIMRRAEISYFMTTKISWNQYNQMPFDSFRWKGLDGTEILTHFVTTPSGQWFKTYNAMLTPQEIKGAWDVYQQKDIHDEILVTYGYGDGGGGPTEEMLMTAAHLKAIPSFPQVQLGRVNEFFQRLDQIREKTPIWEGELYLEYHRGTYTSQAQNKKFNREAEFLMQQAEFLASLAAAKGFEYPNERFRRIWERILLNQFHDILPGSSIHEVYEDSSRDYAWIRAEAEKIISETERTLIQSFNSNEKKSITLINTLGWRRYEPFLIPANGLPDSIPMLHKDSDVSVQSVQTVSGEKMLLIDGAKLHAFSATSFHVGEEKKETRGVLLATNASLENDLLTVKFNRRGEIVSLFDKEIEREVLHPDEPANVFQAFEDKPLAHDAWDIDIYYQDKLLTTGDEARMELVEQGPLRATIKVTKTILDGIIEQNISIYRSSRRIDFDTKVEWSNKDVLLKAAFPVAIHANAATYDIQFGNLERPTHWNTSWDWARFETCAHKWVDLSEGDYGVSLINNCKYGHDIRKHTMRLTLIKCAGAPDPKQDVGTHYFTYSLYPHPSDWRAAHIPQRAHELNVQPMVFAGNFSHPRLENGQSFAAINRENVIFETLKCTEKGNAFVLRLHECYNQRGNVKIRFHAPPQKAVECNLLERDDQEVELEGNEIRFFIKPYEIRTFKVWF
ncbi:MAG: alpha-mannosidase [Candidatus Omnitrophota bacterium]|jgi:alpha-mannosidase|nr:MAG: alpha-mannosidase [Candidatus Omnitrophota bacterium]